MSADFYVLDPDSLRRDHLSWWRPSSQGYTSRLDEAGLYTETFARSSGIAVHRDHAREASVTVVDRSRLRMTGALDDHDLRRNVEEASAEVCFDESPDAVIARAEIGGLMFGASGHDRRSARLALVALVQIAGPKERGEPIT